MCDRGQEVETVVTGVEDGPWAQDIPTSSHLPAAGEGSVYH